MTPDRATNLHGELIRLQEQGSLLIDDEIYISDLPVSTVTDRLNEMVDSLQADPESLLQLHNLDAAKSFIKHMKDLTDENKSKFVDIILSAFRVFLTRLNDDIACHDTSAFDAYRQALEAYILLWHCLVVEAEKLWKDRKESKTPSFLIKKQRDSNKSSARSITSASWNWANSRIIAARIANKLVSSDIKPLYAHQSDLDTLLGLVLKTVFAITDDSEIVKDPALEDSLVETLTVCSIKYPKKFGTSIESKVFHDYLREEGLVDFAVELAKRLCSTAEGEVIVGNILKVLAATPINCEDTPIVKAFSKFLLRVSICLPKEIIKQMVHLQSLLYSESYTVRLTVIEVMGNLVYLTLGNSPRTESFSSLESYYHIFKDRYRDISSNVRVKVLQTINKLADRRNANSSSSYIPLNLRPHFVEMTVGRLLDKSTNVRRNAIRLLAKLIETSPFVLQRDSGSLSYQLLSSRKDQLLQLMQAKIDDVASGPESWDQSPRDDDSNLNRMDIDNEEEDMIEARDKAPDNIFDPMIHNSIKALLIYYTDALSFYKSIEAITNTMLQLVMSNYKGEAVEAMKFFIVCDKYNMEFAKVGIRKMVHKIWDKDVGESGRMSVRETLIKCYAGLYLQKDAADLDPEVSASNLVNCALDMSLSELTSFEQFLCSIYETHISNPIVDSLWNIFTSLSESHSRKLGSIIVLGSLARADSAVITNNIDHFLRFFSTKSSSDGLVLPKYVCAAIAQLRSAPLKDFDSLKDHKLAEQLVACITNLILEPNNTEDWFGCAEQAISAIYIISKSPNKICGAIIRAFAIRCFSQYARKNKTDPNISGDMDVSADDCERQDECNTSISGLVTSRLDLCKLFFIVGHVSTKQLVYLEDTEQEWKHNRQAEISRLQAAKNSRDSKLTTEELDALISTEEEITSYMQNIKERELLYGKVSLLGLFAHIISFVCANSTTFDDPLLHNISIISLCKLMCISPVFCEDNLPLLLFTLESSKDPIVRNNIIIGLGDLTMCFNSILDKHITRLYDRLDDPDPSVRKSAITLLSFLILNGMVRIRGQISTMVKCLSDPDPSIKNVARLFFSEFSSKDNSIYNNLVDIISNLSSATSGVSEQDFQSIFKIILDSVKKEKFTENLIEKLCQRLRDSDLPCQCRNLSFCLSSLVQNSDRCMKRFMDCLPYYSNRLGDPVIFSRSLEVCAKFKKSASQDLRQSIEKFECVLREFHKKCVSDAKTEDCALRSQQNTESVG